ncbi:ARM repeat superfamily protein [Hibiscus syriacus]|uniref:ARM repeat superfamily protein n=1 Tax=Hibiscus syriacus TaxID=106335 RepID=A0A6A3CVD8_HIBSY|nr:ARM repeat superfamily protein [Hibiscus syriacus]
MVKEIRDMAREAREIEKKESKNHDEEGDMLDEALNSTSKIRIEKEIGARLNMLEKKLNSKRESFPGSFIGLLDKDGEDAKGVKKFKFRGPEKISSNGAKGFSGLTNGSKSSYENGISKCEIKFHDSKQIDTELREVEKSHAKDVLLLRRGSLSFMQELKTEVEHVMPLPVGSLRAYKARLDEKCQTRVIELPHEQSLGLL